MFFSLVVLNDVSKSQSLAVQKCFLKFQCLLWGVLSLNPPDESILSKLLSGVGDFSHLRADTGPGLILYWSAELVVNMTECINLAKITSHKPRVTPASTDYRHRYIFSATAELVYCT